MIYLVRHAESLPRHHKNYHEGYDTALSRFGKWQAKAVGKRLKKVGIRDIVTSPLVRTKETAEIIAAVTGGSLEGDERFAEYAPSRTLRGDDFKEAKRRTRADHDFVPQDGESVNQSVERFLDGLRHYAKKYPGAFCVVSHALVIQNVLMKLLSLNETPGIDEVSITAIEYNGDTFHPLYINKPATPIVGFANRIRRFGKVRGIWE